MAVSSACWQFVWYSRVTSSRVLSERADQTSQTHRTPVMHSRHRGSLFSVMSLVVYDTASNSWFILTVPLVGSAVLSSSSPRLTLREAENFSTE